MSIKGDENERIPDGVEIGLKALVAMETRVSYKRRSLKPLYSFTEAHLNSMKKVFDRQELDSF